MAVFQIVLTFEGGKGKNSIVASKNLLSRKKLSEDVPADAEAIANKVLDEQKRVEGALEANESIKTSLKFIDKETKAAKEFSGADFASQILSTRGKPKPRPVHDGQEATPTHIIEPNGPANGLRDLGLVDGATVRKPDNRSRWRLNRIG